MSVAPRGGRDRITSRWRRLVELAYAVAAHRRPVRVVAAHRVGVGALRVEKALAPTLEHFGEIRRNGDEHDRFAAQPADLSQRKVDLRDLERQLAAFTEPQVFDDVAPLGDEPLGASASPVSTTGEPLGAVGLEALDVGQIGAREKQIGHRRELAPLLEVGVQARRPERRPLADVPRGHRSTTCSKARRAPRSVARLLPGDAGVEARERARSRRSVDASASSSKRRAASAAFPLERRARARANSAVGGLVVMRRDEDRRRDTTWGRGRRRHMPPAARHDRCREALAEPRQVARPPIRQARQGCYRRNSRPPSGVPGDWRHPRPRQHSR